MGNQEADLNILRGQIIKLNEQVQALVNASKMGRKQGDDPEAASEATDALTDYPFHFGQREAEFIVSQHGAKAIFAACEITQNEGPDNPKPYLKRVLANLKGEKPEARGKRAASDSHEMAWDVRWEAMVQELGGTDGARRRCADMLLARHVAGPHATEGQRKLYERMWIPEGQPGHVPLAEALEWQRA